MNCFRGCLGRFMVKSLVRFVVMAPAQPGRLGPLLRP